MGDLVNLRPVPDDPDPSLPPLPVPETSEGEEWLREYGCDASTRGVYGFLYSRRDDPPSMVEIMGWAAARQGEAHAQTGRRLRYLREIGIDVPAVMSGPKGRMVHRYPLKGWRPGGPRRPEPQISGRLRGEVLAPARCGQCGKTPLEDGVKLVVDHKIPLSWGGTSDRENLWPLCEECNGNKRNFYKSHDAHADRIKAAISHDSPHMRIGELLKAFEGEWVSAELIGIVASAIQFQEDWQKRQRELKVLGWDYDHQNRYNEGARVRSYYRLTKWEPWPTDSDPGTEIRRREKARKAAKNAGLAAAGLAPDEDEDDAQQGLFDVPDGVDMLVMDPPYGKIQD